MNNILLTYQNGERVVVNFDLVTKFREFTPADGKRSGTLIRIGTEMEFSVKESFEEIQKLAKVVNPVRTGPVVLPK